MSQAQLFEDEYPLTRSCPGLNQFRMAEVFNDLIIEVEDSARLYAHKIILAARIHSLRASLDDTSGKDVTVLRWPSVPLSLATSLLHYVYTGQVEMTQYNVRGMITFARMVNLPVLENWGTQFLINTMNIENLETRMEFARSLNMEILMNACLRHMKEQFESLVQSDLFGRLPAETVLTLIRSDDLAVRSEETVFNAISRWTSVSKDLEDEKLRLHVPAMLKEIQWPQTTGEFREGLLSSHHIFQNSMECTVLLARIINWIGAADRNRFSCPFNQNRRLPTAIYVFGKANNQNQWSVLRFDSKMQNEERFADMAGRWCASYSVVDGNIFVVGGNTTQQLGSTRVDEFLINERRWRERAPLAGRRRWHAAAVMRVDDAAGEHGRKKALIGVFGGNYQEGRIITRLTSCEVYDVSQNRWYKLPDLQEKRVDAAAACLPGDDRVFLFGGYDGVARLDSVAFCQLGADWQEKARSSSSADFWLPTARMKTARSGMAAAHVRGRIVVAGGHDGRQVVNVVEMFSPPDDRCQLGQWTELAAMKQCRMCFSLLSTGDAVFALGNEGQPANTVESFTAPEDSVDLGNDLTAWVWSTKSPVQTLESIVGAVCSRI